jgi:peptidyl-prolyl cis-trans isomerase B (cyclophilin B)
VKRLITALVLGAICTAVASAAATDPIVTLTTSKGVITIQVYKSEAPITAGNFLDLVKRGFYKNMVFHRVVPGFVIQTGDPLSNGSGGFTDPKTGAERTIKLETRPGLKHDAAGVVAMARSPDPDSASSQFYITLAPTHNLDGGYAVFGRVVKGLDVVKKIGAKEVNPQMGLPRSAFERLISAKMVGPSSRAKVVKPAAPAKKK